MAEIYVVASGKGGVGKSTFVAGISKCLRELGKKVLAFDCDIALRSLDILLDCGEQVIFDWGDIISGNCEPGQAVVHGEVDFIAAPRNFSEKFTPEEFRKTVKYFENYYDYIFLDAPAGIDTGFHIAAGGADKAIAVTTPDSVCVRSCAKAVNELENTGISEVKLLINMFEVKPVSRRRLLNIDECMDETCIMLLGVVPFDRQLAFSSVTGTDPGEFSPSSQAFYRIAKRITGEKVELFCE